MLVSDLTSTARLALMRNRIRMSVPFEASCIGCGDSEPLHLAWRERPVMCRNCIADSMGRNLIDKHHLGGRPSPTRTVQVTPNIHAELTFLQEAFWRGKHAPGSIYAVAFDAAAYWARTQFEDGESESG